MQLRKRFYKIEKQCNLNHKIHKLNHENYTFFCKNKQNSYVKRLGYKSRGIIF